VCKAMRRVMLPRLLSTPTRTTLEGRGPSRSRLGRVRVSPLRVAEPSTRGDAALPG
jgi:hypothetical protein